MSSRSFALAFALGALAGVVACSSTPTSSTNDDAGSCRILASRCHPVQTALGKECHELGHDGDDAKCGPRKAECLAECPEVDEDAGEHDGGTDDASADSAPDATADGSDPCPAYCACMAATCATEASYPYANEAACLSACGGFDQKGRTCVAAACEKAKTAADKAHECEHASSPSTCH